MAHASRPRCPAPARVAVLSQGGTQVPLRPVSMGAARPPPPASASAAQAASPTPFRLDVCVLLVSDGDTGLARTPELTYVHGC